MTPRQQETLEIFQRTGSVRATALAIGNTASNVRRALDAIGWDADRRHEHAMSLNPAMQTAKAATGAIPDAVWIKTDGKDGSPAVSAYFRPQREDAGVSLLDAVRTAFDDIQPAEPPKPPKASDDDLATVYTLADIHMGQYSDSTETGQGYDLLTASERVRGMIGQAVTASPSSALAVILLAGDTLHANDYSNATPRSKHVLDVDGRFHQAVAAAIEAVAYAVDLAARKHARVLVKVLPGNHDPSAWLAIMHAMAQRYRLSDRVEVQTEPREMWVLHFGSCMLAAHHGHGGKPSEMVHYLANAFAPIWGQTRHRMLWTGHKHSLAAQDIGGVTWRQLRAVTAPDAYSAGMSYSARSGMEAFTFHRSRGLMTTATVAA